jgi:hypothetical protein
MKFALLGMTALAALAVASPANATLLHNYDLNGTLADSLGGPSLTSNGGVLGATGYTFGANQGLTLGGLNLVSSGDYSIEVGFSFDDLGGWRKIVDFSNLASDAGLYTLGNTLNFFPVAGGPGVFQSGQLVNLMLARTTLGVVTASINGTQQFTFTDASNIALSNTLNFFIDDFATGQGEASSGFVDYIRVSDSSTVSAVPLPAALPLLAASLAGLGFVSRRRKAKVAA